MYQLSLNERCEEIEDIMKKTVLIVGVAGRFGRQCASAMRDAGWHVRGFARTTEKANCIDGVEPYVGDIMDPTALGNAADGADVIVQAANPPYQLWKTLLLEMNQAVIDVAINVGATVVVPQNVYIFGKKGGVWKEDAPHVGSNALARIRMTMEAAYKKAAIDHGLPILAFRMGDFIDGPDHRPSGNWFENHITKAVATGDFTYPGPMDRDHAWAYLPDAARAIVDILNTPNAVVGHLDLNFPGWVLTGASMKTAIEHAVGKPMKRKKMPWVPMNVIALWSAPLRNVVSLRYLWNVPHRLGTDRFDHLLPHFEATDPTEAFTNRWET